MAIVSVTATDTGDTEILWGVPPDADLNKTPIPRGIRKYNGTVAVPALGSGDQTVVQITFTFPTKFIFYPRSFSCQFASDDTTSEFEQFGMMQYDGSNAPIRFLLDSNGGIGRQGVTNLALNIYRPIGGWRQWINVEGGSTGLRFVVTDQSGDTSTAGDIFWNAEFWFYDQEQCMNYPINLFEQLMATGYS